MYKAVGNQVFVYDELFITIHPTHSNISLDEQASILAAILDENFSEVENEGNRESLGANSG